MTRFPDAMEYTRLGSTGLKVSRLPRHDDLRIVRLASVDARRGASRPSSSRRPSAALRSSTHADMRAAPREVLGRALKEFARAIRSSSRPKCFIPWARVQTIAACRASICSTRRRLARRLGMDYVDLYQIHRFDYDTPIEETLETLNDIVKVERVHRRVERVCVAVRADARAVRRVAGRGSCRCRTTTTSCIARKSAR